MTPKATKIINTIKNTLTDAHTLTHGMVGTRGEGNAGAQGG